MLSNTTMLQLQLCYVTNYIIITLRYNYEEMKKHCIPRIEAFSTLLIKLFLLYCVDQELLNYFFYTGLTKNLV